MRSNLGAALAVGLAASALAGAAMAQSKGADQVSMGFTPAPSGPVDYTYALQQPDNVRDSYDFNIMMLKKKMDRLTREDGGQLSAAHQESLQKELDDVNRRFHAARFAKR